MKLTVSLDIKKDLTDKEMVMMDDKFRKAIPELVGWIYSPLTGELTLDFSESEDNALLTKFKNWLVKVGGKRILQFEILGLVKRWEE